MKTAPLAIALLFATSFSTLAQTTTTTPPPATPPAASTTSTPWYTRQADEMRASKLIGTNVVNAANETVGEINEVVLGKDGRVAAVVVGVGGFLGMGEREVAMNFSSLKMSRDGSNNLVITVDATKDSLKTAPEWKWDTAKK
jgi:sporulation protein YlmC with PRC-barrel domain